MNYQMNIAIDSDERLTILTALDTYIAECEKMAALTVGGDYSKMLTEWSIKADAVRKKVARTGAQSAANLERVERMCSRWEQSETWDGKPNQVERIFGKQLRAALSGEEIQ